MGVFRFKRFEVVNEASAMKVNTDGVVLGACVPLHKDVRRVLDVGTGTGTVALMAAQRLEEAGAGDYFITGIDVDGIAAVEAGENFRRSPWSAHLESVCVSLSGFRPSEPFDLIVSNPPFFDSSLPNSDSRSALARHEGELSCFSLIDFAAANLSPEGSLSMIFPASREDGILRYAGAAGFVTRSLLRVKTTVSKPPSRVVASFGFTAAAPVGEDVLTLMEKGKRTLQYASLTKNFYL